MNDRPIDKIRKSALSMTLPEDAGGISDMCEINGSLHMIGGKAIYRVQLADEIDPQRTNIGVPNTHQKVLSVGTESPIVRQVLMTAKRLFGNKVLGPDFDYKGAINLSFDALQDLTVMSSLHEELSKKLRAISEEMKNAAVRQRSFTVPTVGGVRASAESFLQKADHAALDLFGIVKLFYGDAVGQGLFQGLHRLIKEKFGDDDPFTKFLTQVLPFLQFVRNARNAMEHPDASKSVEVTDILLLPSGELQPPCIEVIHLETAQPSVHMLDLMGHFTNHLAIIFEVMVAYLCGCNVQPFAGLPLGIIEYTEDQQKAYKCRYGYGTRMGGQMVPFG
jgi:hypothetical protein